MFGLCGRSQPQAALAWYRPCEDWEDSFERAMSAMTHHVAAISARRLLDWSKLKAALVEWRNRAVSRRELKELSDHDLSDLALTRPEADNEASKPFWQD
jgi:uncharacterized protein YjiS (DUF1127 family)